MQMTLALAALAVAGQIGQPATGYPGRMSTLRPLLHGQPATVANGSYALDVERVLKVQAIVGKRDKDTYGVEVYGGSLSLRAPSGAWGFELPAGAVKNTVAWPDEWNARVTQTITAGGWRGEATADLAADWPAVWFTLRRAAGTGPIEAGLVGYGWANRQAPLDWTVGDKSLTRALGEELNVPLTAAKQLTVVFRDAAGFTGALRFTPGPTAFDVTDDGMTWSYAPQVAEARLCYAVLPGSPAAGVAEQVLTMAAGGPPQMTQTFGCDGGPAGDPWVQMTARGQAALALPASLADEAQGTSVDMAEGDVKLVPASKLRFSLDTPPLLDKVKPDFKPLPDDARQRLDGLVQDILAHQEPNGAFSFGLKRAFYDGTTCAALMVVADEVSPDLKPKVLAAVEKGLRHLWDDQAPCEQWPGVSLPPEQAGFHVCGTDYPEIESCVLQATVLYAAETDGAYAKTRWPQIRQQFEQLRRFYDVTGIALAQPGPGYWHVIAESAIGGYLTWQALYHLALMAGQPAYAAEAKARAAYAWKAWPALFAWRTEYGEPAAGVNGIVKATVQCMTEPPWVYVQSAWFTYLPCFALPREDVFGVWRMLEAQPWWEYTGKQKSTQRCYDAADAIALARAGYVKDVQKHWPEVAKRPYGWDSFDQTPVLAVPAEAWLYSLGITR